MLAKLTLVAAAGLSMIVAAGCQKQHHADPVAAPPARVTAVAALTASKIATTRPAVRSVAGEVRFTDMGNGVIIVANVWGLAPNKKHGFHIHEKGDLSAADLSSAGPHYDPVQTHQHGGPSQTGATHAGDLGNLEANDKGVAHLEITVPNVSLGGPNTLLGRSVIVHEKPDDLMTNPSGASGDRIAGGVIQLSK